MSWTEFEQTDKESTLSWAAKMIRVVVIIMLISGLVVIAFPDLI